MTFGGTFRDPFIIAVIATPEHQNSLRGLKKKVNLYCKKRNLLLYVEHFYDHFYLLIPGHSLILTVPKYKLKPFV